MSSVSRSGYQILRTWYYTRRVSVRTVERVAHHIASGRDCVRPGSLCEIHSHIYYYRWLNYYVRMTKTSFGPTISVYH